MSDPQKPTAEGIARAARDVREASEKSGRPVTQTQAEARVREAVRQGDRKRDHNNR